ncbi:MAG: hypothetical protein LBT05_15715 [Planctomycetaceae bacterium]|jgi:hypothetical protein|nr:hypothetical protein [Planctomycetaceae bacterium]
MKYLKCLTAICFLIFAAEIFGCQRGPKRPDDLPKLTPCTVSVTFGGKTMEGVAVFLTPENNELNKWGAAGKTDANGKAKLTTSFAFEGVVPGKYIISFKKWGESTNMNQPPSLIPKKYTQGQSKETITVTKEQREYSFEL